MEHRYAGPRAVSIIGLKSGTRDLTENKEWGHLVRPNRPLFYTPILVCDIMKFNPVNAGRFGR